MERSENVDRDEELSSEETRKARMSFAIDTKIGFTGTPIGIKEYSVKEGLSKKIFYLIVGADKSGEFQISRRYTEFALLRSVLINMWPGFYIPKIPTKKKIGNLEPEFIEKRKKLLELFLKKMSNLEYMYESPVVQSFLHDKSDFKSAVKNLFQTDIKNSENIVAKFPRYANDSLSPDIDEKLIDAEKVFKGAIDNLNSLANKASALVEHFDIYESDLIEFMNNLKNLGIAYTGKALEYSARDSFFNPYVIILDWAIAEMLDLEAICEAIESRKRYEGVVSGLESKLENFKKNLAKVQSGKRSLTQLLKRDSIENIEAKTQSDIESMENGLTTSRLCHKVITLRLANKEIPMFKAAKLETYKHIMKVFANASIQELSQLAQQLQALEVFIDSS